MSLYISVNKHQALSAAQQLELLALPRNKRVRLLKTLGRAQKKKARSRIRSQAGTDGQPFEPRKKKKGGKLLKHIDKGITPYVFDGDRLELKHGNPMTGRIAALHHSGGAEKMTSARMTRIHGGPDYKSPSTRKQAKALVANGYKVRRAKGKGYRKASVKEAMELSKGQAAIILQQLRGKPKRRSWQIPVPARPFLGDSPANVQRQLVEILEQMRK